MQVNAPGFFVLGAIMAHGFTAEGISSFRFWSIWRMQSRCSHQISLSPSDNCICFVGGCCRLQRCRCGFFRRAAHRLLADDVLARVRPNDRANFSRRGLRPGVLRVVSGQHALLVSGVGTVSLAGVMRPARTCAVYSPWRLAFRLAGTVAR